MQILIVGTGGFLGSVARYIIINCVSKLSNDSFPFGTFLVNISGCFLLGFFISLTAKKITVGPNIKLLFTAGFMGAYTTFSTFSYDTSVLIKSGDFLLATINATASVLIGIISLLGGMAIGQIL